MKHKRLLFTIVLILAFFLPSCTSEKPEKNDRIVVAIPADAGSLNPLFAFSFQEVNITELLYLSLVHHEWNDSAGDVKTYPMACLLYTSDAADEEDSVDLGGRRI